jgi:ferritin-like metal-binding protein YciE
MAEVNERDAKLVQFLGEAHAKEKELETALQAHIAMTSRAPYKKRLQQHLRETKDHARQLERRVKQLGGGPGAVQALQEAATTAVGKAVAAAKGPVDTLRGVGEQEQMLKNAKQEYSEEAKEIATYRSIQAFAEKVGDRETAKLARGILREEERMASFLERQITALTNAVVQAEVPAAQRNGGTSRRRRSSRSSRSGASRSSGSRSSRSTGSRRKSSSSRRAGGSSRSSGSRSGSSRSSGSRSRSSARSGRRAGSRS